MVQIVFGETRKGNVKTHDLGGALSLTLPVRAGGRSSAEKILIPHGTVISVVHLDDRHLLKVEGFGINVSTQLQDAHEALEVERAIEKAAKRRRKDDKWFAVRWSIVFIGLGALIGMQVRSAIHEAGRQVALRTVPGEEQSVGAPSLPPGLLMQQPMQNDGPMMRPAPPFPLPPGARQQQPAQQPALQPQPSGPPAGLFPGATAPSAAQAGGPPAGLFPGAGSAAGQPAPARAPAGGPPAGLFPN